MLNLACVSGNLIDAWGDANNALEQTRGGIKCQHPLLASASLSADVRLYVADPNTSSLRIDLEAHLSTVEVFLKVKFSKDRIPFSVRHWSCWRRDSRRAAREDRLGATRIEPLRRQARSRRS